MNLKPLLRSASRDRSLLWRTLFIQASSAIIEGVRWKYIAHSPVTELSQKDLYSFT